MATTEQDLREKVSISKFAANIAKTICQLHTSSINGSFLIDLLATLKNKSPIPYDLEEILNSQYSLSNAPYKISSNVSDVVNDIPAGNPIIILDLDETLVNVFKSTKDAKSYILPRPGAHLFIEALYNFGVEIVLWTAGVEQHARSALGIIDPNQRIKRVIHRPSMLVDEYGNNTGKYTWAQDHMDPNFYKKKALCLLPAELQKYAILIDDNIISLSHESTLNNSICIPSYASGRSHQGYYVGEPQFDLHLIRILSVLLDAIITFKTSEKCGNTRFSMSRDFLTAEQREYTEHDIHGISSTKSITIQTINEKIPNLTEENADFFVKQFVSAFHLICRHPAALDTCNYSSVIRPLSILKETNDAKYSATSRESDSFSKLESFAHKTPLMLR